MHFNPSQFKSGHYYSNGQYGNQWSIRLIIQELGEETNAINYQIVAGKERSQTGTCSLEEFARWAKYEVYRDENSWKMIDGSSATS
jgi:hypothetical protein